MPSPLIRNMVKQYGYPVLDEAAIEAFLAAHHEVVLFFAENPRQFPESNDVAMILPELVKAFNGRLQAALISRTAEHRLQARFAFNSWPALVFLRDGELLGSITQVQNWDDYLREIQRLLNAGPVATPSFKIPVVSASTHDCH